MTVVDQAGRLLTRSDSEGRDLNDAQLKYASEVEARYQQRIEAILNPILGQGNVHAQVTAQINFDRSEQTDEKYQPNANPNNTAIRSRQTSTNDQNGSPYPGGVPVRCRISLRRPIPRRSPTRSSRTITTLTVSRTTTTRRMPAPRPAPRRAAARAAPAATTR